MWAGGAVWAKMASNPAPGFLMSPEESSCHVRLEALTSQKTATQLTQGTSDFPSNTQWEALHGWDSFRNPFSQSLWKTRGWSVFSQPDQQRRQRLRDRDREGETEFNPLSHSTPGVKVMSVLPCIPKTRDPRPWVRTRLIENLSHLRSSWEDISNPLWGHG